MLRRNDSLAERIALGGREYMSGFGDWAHENRIASAVIRLFAAYLEAARSIKVTPVSADHEKI